MLGFAGTTLLTSAQAILSDRHGERRDRALTEANVGAAACAVLAPLLLGLFSRAPRQAGVRPWPCPPSSWPACTCATGTSRCPPATAGRPAAGRARLPLSCWLLATLIAVGIAVEFCPIYFGAELLTAQDCAPPRPPPR